VSAGVSAVHAQRGSQRPGDAPLVLAIDEGTTNTKALLVDAASGEVVARGSAPLGIVFPGPDRVEQDAEDLWAATLAAVDSCLADAGGRLPAAVAVTNQRESVVVWSRSTGRALGPVLGWQDSRTAQACAALLADGAGPLVRRLTGLSLDPLYSAPKMRWLLDLLVGSGVDLADICLGTVDSWLIWQLTGGAVFAIEAGNASRTLLLDIAQVRWSAALLDLFGIPAAALPEVRASDGGFGVTAAIGSLPAGLPIAAVMADSHAALYQYGAGGLGEGKATYGTGSSVMTVSPLAAAAPEGITTTLAWVSGEPTYAREGNIIASGAALDWMAATLGSAGGSGGAFLSGLAATVPDAGGVAFVPAFAGLGAPYWDRAATGIVTGVTGGTTRAHLARAALEAVAHQVADVVEAIESDGAARLDVLHADGGSTASALLMQLQADLLGRAVHVSDVADASALGVARLAARTLGAPDGAEHAKTAGTDARGGSAVVVASLAESPRRAARARWAEAVARSRGQSVDRMSAP
jgi:glycerol kinase